MADQTQFIAETQRQFYADIARYYHEELGCRQLVNASNWITADAVQLNDLERWTYTACDVIAVNKYYGGVHVGRPATAGASTPATTSPARRGSSTPATCRPTSCQPAGHPMVITESSWVSPEGYQNEGPFLMAAYQSVTGVDAYYWFSCDAPQYNTRPLPRFPEHQRPAPGREMVLLRAGHHGQFPRRRPDVPQGLPEDRQAGRPRGAVAPGPVGPQDAADRRGRQLRPQPQHRQHRQSIPGRKGDRPPRLPGRPRRGQVRRGSRPHDHRRPVEVHRPRPEDASPPRRAKSDSTTATA